MPGGLDVSENRTVRATRYMIVNADDFGASAGINRAVRETFEAGVLTSASLMVTQRETKAAAELSHELPGLSVGLHIDLSGEDGGRPPVPLDDLSLVEQEMSRQSDHFHQLLDDQPTHLDAHHNLHRDARFRPLFLALADRIGVPLREHSPVSYFSAFYAQWDGETHPEQVSVENVRAMLANDITGRITEFSCHPGHCDPHFHSDYDQERELELATLMDPRMPAILAEAEVELVSYHDLDRLVAGGRDR